MKQETRYIALSDESGMGGELIIFINKFSCQTSKSP